MPAPVLRAYTAYPTGTTSTTVVPAVATSRALVVSKLIVATPSAVTITEIRVGNNPIVQSLALAAGEVYTETGLVVLAASAVTVILSAGSTATVTVFGEEVDN